MSERKAFEALGLPESAWSAFSGSESHRLVDLASRLKALGSVVIGYSGGVDSAVLCLAATRVLGSRAVLALLVDSASLARREKKAALDLAAAAGLNLATVAGEEMQDPAYLRNQADRCFHCKADLVKHMHAAMARGAYACGAYGKNADDGRDFRPGHRAATLGGLHAPLAEAGLGKPLVRRLAKAYDLPVWDKPAAPCLSSRIPHGTPVTAELLRRVESAEDVLAEMGFRAFRVRAESYGARVEIAHEEWPHLGGVGNGAGRIGAECAFDPEASLAWVRVEKALQALGFAQVVFDAQGLQSGGLNARLGAAERRAALTG
jgi:pyridinium-3,5-biscarboxylic acid mononucleotide sulfurtransferase